MVIGCLTEEVTPEFSLVLLEDSTGLVLDSTTLVDSTDLLDAGVVATDLEDSLALEVDSITLLLSAGFVEEAAVVVGLVALERVVATLVGLEAELDGLTVEEEARIVELEAGPQSNPMEWIPTSHPVFPVFFPGFWLG